MIQFKLLVRRIDNLIAIAENCKDFSLDSIVRSKVKIKTIEQGNIPRLIDNKLQSSYLMEILFTKRIPTRVSIYITK